MYYVNVYKMSLEINFIPDIAVEHLAALRFFHRMINSDQRHFGVIESTLEEVSTTFTEDDLTKINDAIFSSTVSPLLDSRTIDVVTSRTGIGTPDGKGVSLDELAKRHGVTRESVRQIENIGTKAIYASVLSKLRHGPKTKVRTILDGELTQVGVLRTASVRPYKMLQGTEDKDLFFKARQAFNDDLLGDIKEEFGEGNVVIADVKSNIIAAQQNMGRPKIHNSTGIYVPTVLFDMPSQQ
jgi:hypothetical protein